MSVFVTRYVRTTEIKIDGREQEREEIEKEKKTVEEDLIHDDNAYALKHTHSNGISTYTGGTYKLVFGQHIENRKAEKGMTIYGESSEGSGGEGPRMK